MFKSFLKHVASHTVRHNLELAFHSAYCGTLYLEGHGLYATVGGALGVIILINWVMGDQ